MNVANNTRKTRGAAAYVVPKTSRLIRISTWMELGIVLEIILLLMYPSWSAKPFAWVLVGISIPLASWLILRRIVIQLLLRSPASSGGQLINPRWKSLSFEGWGGESLTAYRLPSEKPTTGLILYIHGYGSSLRYSEERCQHLNDLGIDIVEVVPKAVQRT